MKSLADGCGCVRRLFGLREFEFGFVEDAAEQFPFTTLARHCLYVGKVLF